MLCYMKAPTDTDISGEIAIIDIISVSKCDDDGGTRDQRDMFCFEITTTGTRDYMLCAETEDERTAWVEALQPVRKPEQLDTLTLVCLIHARAASISYSAGLRSRGYIIQAG